MRHRPADNVPTEVESTPPHPAYRPRLDDPVHAPIDAVPATLPQERPQLQSSPVIRRGARGSTESRPSVSAPDFARTARSPFHTRMPPPRSRPELASPAQAGTGFVQFPKAAPTRWHD